MSNRELRCEIDHYAYDKARVLSGDDDREHYKQLHNIRVKVTVVWDNSIHGDYTEEIDTEYSFEGTYPDWLIHLSECLYHHVGESEDWEKIAEGEYKVVYCSYN